MADENTNVPLARLALNKKPSEFKAAVVERLSGMLRSAIDNRKVEVAKSMFKQEG